MDRGSVDATVVDAAVVDAAVVDATVDAGSPAVLAISDGPTFDFGAVLVSDSVTHTFAITKSGDRDAADVTGALTPPFSFAGGAFPGSGGTCGQIIAADCTIVVTFAPIQAGSASGAIEIHFNSGPVATIVTRAVVGSGELLLLTYWEQQNVFGGGAYGSHRLLIGPGSSADPEDGSWSVLADGAAMYNAGAFSGWTLGLVADITAWSGQSVRVAYHYYGSNKDKWYVDDVCVYRGAGNPMIASCILAQTFDSTSGLPTDWSDVAGQDNTDPDAWRASVDQGHTAISSAVADASLRTTLKDRYLVSPVFVLP